MKDTRRMATPSAVRLPVGFQARSHAAREPMARPKADEGYELFSISGCALVIGAAAVVVLAMWGALTVLALAAGAGA